MESTEQLTKVEEVQYEVLSPDGFAIAYDSNYKTIEEAQNAINDFVKRFIPQGYYGTVLNGERYKMPISEIAANCRIVQV